jgi:adenylate cyclase
MPEQTTRKILAPHRLAKWLGAGLTLAVVALYFTGIALLDLLELKTYDMRLRGLRAAPPQQVAIAAIDEQSLAELGRWPWSRVTLSTLVDRLDQAGARVIAFDAFFPEPESPQADERLARAVGAGRSVVLSTVFLFEPELVRHLRPERLEEARASIEAQAITDVRHRGTATDFPMPAPYGALANVPALQRSAAYAGHINVFPDAEDGTLRRVPLVVRYAGRYYPSFDVQAAQALRGGQPLILHTAAYGITGIEIGGRLVATDEYGQALVRYRGPEQTFTTISAADILGGRVDPARLRDRIVLIGATAKGLGDIRVTPYGAAYPGVEVHANVIQDLLEGGPLQRPEWMSVVDVAVLAALGLALTLLLPRLGVRRGALLALGALAGYLLVAHELFQALGLWLNVVYPSLLVAALFVSATLVQYFSAESEKRSLRTAFQYYVPATVIDELVSDTAKLRLGGEKRELTVLFCDIRGFTSISELLAPEELVRFLNIYFTAMTRKVFDHKGSLDKYIGDSIMAVFGAPIAEPRHARLACRAALDMVAALDGLEGEWRRNGLPALEVKIGIGINTGAMIAGNMGSENRFNYTVTGDAVNLASRIESLNKTYGTSILVSEYTYAQAKDELPRAREIDRVQVRGRSQPVGLYELIPEGRHASLDWLEEFAGAYALLREGAHAQAAERFEALHARIADPVSAYHARTCRTPHRRESDWS